MIVRDEEHLARLYGTKPKVRPTPRWVLAGVGLAALLTLGSAGTMLVGVLLDDDHDLDHLVKLDVLRPNAELVALSEEDAYTGCAALSDGTLVRWADGRVQARLPLADARAAQTGALLEIRGPMSFTCRFEDEAAARRFAEQAKLTP